jgi:hypothetical protein
MNRNKKHGTIAFIGMLSILIIMGFSNVIPASAQLNQQVIEEIRVSLNKAFNDLQSNSTAAVPLDLRQVNTTITQHICNMAICPSGTIKSDQANTVRTPLKEALAAVQAGNAAAARGLLMQSNQSLSSLGM